MNSSASNLYGNERIETSYGSLERYKEGIFVGKDPKMAGLDSYTNTSG